jgi:large subunit ribosomal protein L35
MPQPGKTHKGLAKRFKVTASGKVKHRNANRGHLMGKKSGNRKRRLRKDGVGLGIGANSRQHTSEFALIT